MYTIRKSYKDFDGNTRVEDFRFHLSEQEVLEAEMHEDGGLEGLIESIVSSQNRGQMIDLITRLMKMSYGIKDPDGRGFRKTEEAWLDFKSTNAFSDIFMELATDTDKATEFVNGIMPEDLNEKMGDLNENPEFQKKIEELKVLAGGAPA